MAEANTYTPSVTTAEIEDWEKRFREAVSPLTKFDTEDGKPSIKLYNGISGVEASWSGIIPLKADNYIKWSFSIQNEPFLEAKCAISEESKKAIDGLYDFYSIWRTEWEQSLTIPPSADKIAKTSTELPAQGPAAVPATASKTAVAEAYNKGIDRTKEKIIEGHSDRMKRLAGIL